MSKYIIIDEDFKFQVLNELKALKALFSATQKSTDPSDLMDTSDAIAYMKVTRRTLYKYRKRENNPLPFEKVENGKIYYWRNAVDKFLKSEKG